MKIRFELVEGVTKVNKRFSNPRHTIWEGFRRYVQDALTVFLQEIGVVKALNSAASKFNQSLRKVYKTNCQEVTVKDSDALW